jgi:hypothetical protein
LHTTSWLVHPEVDDRLGLGALLAQAVDMGHDIVAEVAFEFGGPGQFLRR